MAVTVVSFRWLEILEKEFDKNFVDLDLLIGDLDGEEPDLVYSARQKLAGLSSCFAQLTHKAQTIFQNSAKTEAELVDLRAELVQCKTRQEVLEEDCRNLVLQLHSLQLDRLPSNQNPEQYKEKIDNALKHSPSKGSYAEDTLFRQNGEMKRMRHELAQFAHENSALRTSVLALTSEVYGARLAAKYLDKELAGRIQQLQLLGKDMRTDVRDKLWRQLESEILLHRHKTVIRACRNRPHLDLLKPARPRHDGNNNSSRLALPPANINSSIGSTGAVVPAIGEEDAPGNVGEKRVVVVRRQHGQGLGISITGGREHGVPILISELEDGGPAHQCRNLFVGDAILSVDDVSLENVSHFEAVKVLTSLQRDEVRLVVQFIAVDTDEETSLSEDLYGYRYRFFDTEVMDSCDVIGLHPAHADPGHLSNTPTAPRTPDGVRDDSVSTWKATLGDCLSDRSDVFTPGSPKLVDLSIEGDESTERLDIDLFGQRFRTELDYPTLDDLVHTVVELAENISERTTEKPPNIGSPKVNKKKVETLLDHPSLEKEPCKLEEELKEKVVPESNKIEKVAKPLPSTVSTPSCRGPAALNYLDETIFSGLEDTTLLDTIVKSFSEDDFSCVEAPMTSDSGLCSSDDARGRSYRLPRIPSLDNSPEKIELRTLQQIFDRSFSSNLSSPHESTSFDDDIFSTEHSDEKNGNYLDDFRNKMNDMKNAYNPKKAQKFFPKNVDDYLKKPKRGSLEMQKRPKSMRKLKEGKSEKKKTVTNREDGDYERKSGFNMKERFEENLLEYSVKDPDVEDALETTRQLSLQYGLRLPDAQREPRSPECTIKVIEGHFKSSLPPVEKPKAFRSTRFDSFGDPDFGTPV